MKSFIQTGNTITVAAPTGGAASGDGVLVGSFFGVAAHTAAEGAPLEVALTGVYGLAKKPADTFAVGDKVYFDAAAKQITSTATSNKLVGAATQVAGAAATTVAVRLNGATV